MSDQIWVNNRQPQTLYISQVLMYIRGGFGILFGALFALGSAGALGIVYVLLTTVGMIAAAFGIANEKKWGYRLGIAAAIAPLALVALDVVFNVINVRVDLIGIMFDIALVALLLHPMSKDYAKVWFK